MTATLPASPTGGPDVDAAEPVRRPTLDRYDDDGSRLRRAFSRFPSGVAALAAEVDGEPVGFVASTFTVGVSMDPPLVSVAVQNSGATWPVLRGAARIGVSVLGADQEQLCRRLAAKDPAGRFAGAELERGTGGALLLGGATLWLECSVLAEVPAGDHQVILLRVEAIAEHEGVAPLVFHGSRFHSVLLPG